MTTKSIELAGYIFFYDEQMSGGCMGTLFLFYAEYKTDDGWIPLNPIAYDIEKKEYRQTSILWGYSYLRDTADKFESLERTNWGFPRDIGELTKELFKPDPKWEVYPTKFMSDEWYKENDYRFFSAPFSAIYNCLDTSKKFRHEGYVDRNDLDSYKLGDLYNLYGISEIEYAELSEKERARYIKYRWNDVDDWYKYFQEISDAVLFNLDALANVNMSSKQFDYGEVDKNNVRIIMERC